MSNQQRVIKFRAFIDGVMRYDIGIHPHITERFEDDSLLLCDKFTNTHIMQFTGLLDKNGKEIYENDIIIPIEMQDTNINFWYTPEGEQIMVGKPYQVKWWNHGWDVPCDPKNWEVIGNIYENPELLNA